MFRTHKYFTAIIIISSGLLMISCAGNTNSEVKNSKVVDVIMDDYVFAVVDTISSGWTTFKMDNRGQETHEFVLHQLPEDKTYQDIHREVIRPLDSLQQMHLEGAIDSAKHEKAVAQTYPKWMREVESFGGGGLLSPGQVSRTTIKLDPGEYVMSCFIPSPNGRRHVFQGMVRSITVTDNPSESAKPEPNIIVTSSDGDISVDGYLGFGTNTIAFEVEEPDSTETASYPSMFLAEPLDPMQRVTEFRDFETHDPPSDLIAGALAVPVGDTSFVSVNLTAPGTYTLVFPHGDKKTVLKEVTVN